jgi:hypothetical protein
MKREDDQQLWDFLGQVTEPRLSPFFARDVLRAVRHRSERFSWLRAWLYPRRLVPATALAAAAIVTLLAIHRPPVRTPSENAPDVVASIEPQDYDVVADLDELLVTDESSLWDDETQTL